MTFSLVARCAETGMFGVAISSSSPAVAARCAYARAGVGAVASQNITDPRLGPLGLDLLQKGLSAGETIAEIRRLGTFIDYRQVLVVDAKGGTAIHSGPKALGIWAEAQGPDVASGGNLLANSGIPQAIVDGFLASKGHLGDRLIAAMRAGVAAGGEAVLDASALTQFDSSALAVLLACQRAAQLRGCTVTVVGLPPQAYQLAKVYGVAPWLEGAARG